MKLGTALVDGTARVVVGVDDHTAVALAPGLELADLIRSWPSPAPGLESAVRDGVPLAVESLSWLPPIPAPGKVVCLALNNSANASRIMSGPSTPATFIKPASSLIGHNAPIRLRPEYGRVHPEPELAVVIGRRGADIPAETAMEHVFGYTILNDLTSPTMRAEDTFHYRAIHPRTDGADGIEYVDTWVSYPGRYKGADTFGPMGPWVTTADEIPDPHDLTIRCLHDDRLITEDSTANLTHKVRDVIAFLSTYLTLEPGDVIAMGTALKATATGGAVQNVDLNRLGGRITVRVSGIGTLSNPVARR